MSGMAKAKQFSAMVALSKPTGKTEKSTEEGAKSMRMETTILATGKMTCDMDMACLYIEQEASTLVNGRWISSMDMGSKHGLMEQSLRDIL